MREAADLARRSNEARSEAEQAMQLEQETRSAAKDLPGRTRAYLYDTRCKVVHCSYWCIFNSDLAQSVTERYRAQHQPNKKVVEPQPLAMLS